MVMDRGMGVASRITIPGAKEREWKPLVAQTRLFGPIYKRKTAKKEGWRSHATKELQGGRRDGKQKQRARLKFNWVSLSTRPLLPHSEM